MFISRNVWKVPNENGESRTPHGELQGSLTVYFINSFMIGRFWSSIMEILLIRFMTVRPFEVLSSISHISFMLVLIALGVVLSQIWSNKFWALKYFCMFSFQPTILSLLMVNYSSIITYLLHMPSHLNTISIS